MAANIVVRDGCDDDFSNVIKFIEMALNELEASAAPSGQVDEGIAKLKSTLQGLKRAYVLSVKVARKYDDRENVRKRAALLQDQLSDALNRRLALDGQDGDGGLYPGTLDRAKDLAIEVRLTGSGEDLSQYLVSAEYAQMTGREREAFLINLCYELMVRADKWIHFSELARGSDVIERLIEFPPEYFTSGMMVLNEFATIVRERYGESGARVKIYQQDLRVRLVIETASAKEEIERTLDHYGEVISGRRDVGSFVNTALERVRLEGALELAHARLNAELRISNVLEAEVKARGEQLDHVTRLLADALTSHHEFASRHHEFALSTLEALTHDRYSRVIAEVARIAYDYVDEESRVELAEIASIADRTESRQELDEADSRLRKILKRLTADSPQLIKCLSSAIALGVVSNEAADWLEALLRNLL